MKVGDTVQFVRNEKHFYECLYCFCQNVEAVGEEIKCSLCGYQDFPDAFQTFEVTFEIEGKKYQQHYYDYNTHYFSAINENGEEFWFRRTKEKGTFEIIEHKL